MTRSSISSRARRAQASTGAKDGRSSGIEDLHEVAFSRPTSSMHAGNHDNERTVYLDDDTDQWLLAMRRLHGYRSTSDAIRACLQACATDADFSRRLAEHEVMLAQQRAREIAQKSGGSTAKPKVMP